MVTQTNNHLLVDGRNALYRAIYAVNRDTRPNKHHYVVTLLRQMTGWMNIYRPQSVHVFWDAPRSTIWRKEILPTYKNRDESGYVEDISADLALTQTVAEKLFEFMNVRQYIRASMEADDLIYAACTVMHPHPTVIVTTDSDMTQIPFVYKTSRVFHPKDMKEVEIPNVHPAHKKALEGDESDKVDGYYGIGPKKSQILLESPKKLTEFLKVNGRERFATNLLLIDLSLNPKLLLNQLYVRKVMAKPAAFSRDDVIRITQEYKINGLSGGYADLVIPFQNLK